MRDSRGGRWELGWDENVVGACEEEFSVIRHSRLGVPRCGTGAGTPCTAISDGRVRVPVAGRAEMDMPVQSLILLSGEWRTT